MTVLENIDMCLGVTSQKNVHLNLNIFLHMCNLRVILLFWLFSLRYLMFCLSHSPINRSSVREGGKAKLGAAEKVSAGATASRAEAKGRGTPEHHGEPLSLKGSSAFHSAGAASKCSVLSLA